MVRAEPAGDSLMLFLWRGLPRSVVQPESANHLEDSVANPEAGGPLRCGRSPSSVVKAVLSPLLLSFGHRYFSVRVEAEVLEAPRFAADRTLHIIGKRRAPPVGELRAEPVNVGDVASVWLDGGRSDWPLPQPEWPSGRRANRRKRMHYI